MTTDRRTARFHGTFGAGKRHLVLIFSILTFLALSGCSAGGNGMESGSAVDNRGASKGESNEQSRSWEELLEVEPDLIGYVTSVQDEESSGDSGTDRRTGSSSGEAEMDPDTPVSSPVDPNADGNLGSGRRHVIVEENPSDISGSEKAILYINASTVLLVQSPGQGAGTGDPVSPGEYETISFDEIKVGDLVQVWYDPEQPVMDSYPIQASAAIILVKADQ